MIEIREEATGDQTAVRQINKKAFGQQAEADLSTTLALGLRKHRTINLAASGKVFPMKHLWLWYSIRGPCPKPAV